MRSPMMGVLLYANSVPIYFDKELTSSGQLQNPIKPQIHLTITSDRVVTETSDLDHRCKKTWGIYQ